MEKIKVQTLVAAPIQKVWDRWTQPEHIVCWNFASEDWHCPSALNDLRPGGKFNYTMASKDGKMSFGFEGIYDEVIQHKRISYTILDGRKVVLDFEEMENGTLVTEVFEAESMNAPELQRAGWQAILDNFKKQAEKE